MPEGMSEFLPERKSQNVRIYLHPLHTSGWYVGINRQGGDHSKKVIWSFMQVPPGTSWFIPLMNYEL